MYTIKTPKTRDDFKAFCQAFQGRWVGELKWVTDWPGFGKRGDKITAYTENRVAEDGNVMFIKWYGGNGSGTGMVVFDAAAKRIRCTWANSGGAVSQAVFWIRDKQWFHREEGCLHDGTKTEFTSAIAVSDNGNTHTWTGSGTVGGKKVDDQRDVWRRVSK